MNRRTAFDLQNCLSVCMKSLDLPECRGRLARALTSKRWLVNRLTHCAGRRWRRIVRWGACSSEGGFQQLPEQIGHTSMAAGILCPLVRALQKSGPQVEQSCQLAQRNCESGRCQLRRGKATVCPAWVKSSPCRLPCTSILRRHLDFLSRISATLHRSTHTCLSWLSH